MLLEFQIDIFRYHLSLYLDHVDKAILRSVCRLLREIIPKQRPITMYHLCEEGYLNLVIFAHKNGCILNPPYPNQSTVFVATIRGHLEVLKYLLNNGCYLPNRTIDTAALFGRLEIVRYLYEDNDWSVDEYTIMSASQSGNLNLVKYLHKWECPWDERATAYASMDGNLEILKYLHENGCPWDSTSTCKAVIFNRLEVLKYLHQNGCPIDESVISTSTNKPKIFKYLYENGLIKS
jgi:hypothetical protein